MLFRSYLVNLAKTFLIRQGVVCEKCKARREEDKIGAEWIQNLSSIPEKKPKPVIATFVGKGLPSGTLEVNSNTWNFILKWATERLLQLRIENDKPTSHDETSVTRGHIRGIKEVIALPQLNEPAKEYRMRPENWQDDSSYAGY